MNRRKALKYIPPAIATLVVSPAFSKPGSEKPKRVAPPRPVEHKPVQYREESE